MSRPPRRRLIGCVPAADRYEPHGVPPSRLRTVKVDIDELEAMRLVDEEGLHHDDAAQHMSVSRATVGRILERGRRKVTHALVHGFAVAIGRGKAPIDYHDNTGTSRRTDSTNERRW